jgi:hypothetical protein
MTPEEQRVVRKLRRRYRDKYGQLLTLSAERLIGVNNQVLNTVDDPDHIIDILHILQTNRGIDA